MITRERTFIFEIGGCLVSSEILTEYFVCDFETCHGACCIIGDSGAPLESGEVDSFRKEFDNYRKYMTPEGIGALHKQGFGVVDADGDLVTPLVNNEECVYTSFDEEIFLVGFHEVATGISMDCGVYFDHTGDLCFYEFKLFHISLPFRSSLLMQYPMGAYWFL